MKRTLCIISIALVLHSCSRGASSSNGLRAGTFVATVEGAVVGELKGRAFWMHRRHQYEATPHTQSFILLSTNPAKEFRDIREANLPDTLIRLFRAEQPFTRGRYPVFDVISRKEPIAQLDLITGAEEYWKNIHQFNSTEGTLTITHADDQVVEGEFVFEANDRSLGPQRGLQVIARGKFKALRP
jgi:hypothetical protein